MGRHRLWHWFHLLPLADSCRYCLFDGGYDTWSCPFRRCFKGMKSFERLDPLSNPHHICERSIRYLLGCTGQSGLKLMTQDCEFIEVACMSEGNRL